MNDSAMAKFEAGTRSLEEIATVLERTNDFRVLRRLKSRQEFLSDIPCEETKIGLILDVEATGLNTRTDEVIELGLLKFSYLPDGRVVHVIDTFAAFNEPAVPVTPEISDLTGITNEMLAGKTINCAAVDSFISDVAVVVAHHAAYDRQLVERYFPQFEHLPWMCSATQVPWKSLKFDSGRLVHLLSGIGLFHHAHRAVDDCRALLEILAFRPDGQAETFLGKLLGAARRKTVRIWAESSPFEMKDQLKRRGYRWSDGADGGRKSWYVDIDATMADAELRFLRTEIYGREVDPPMKEFTAFDRFSRRS